MRNPPGRHLLRVATRAVRSSSLLGGGGASSPVSASSGGRPRTRGAGANMLLRATSPPPPSAVAAAACWESRTLRRDGEDDWEEVVAGVGVEGPAASGEPDVDDDYRVVFWSPPTGDEVRAAFSSIQEVFENSFGVDPDETEKQIALLSTSGYSSSSNSSGSDDWVEPAAYVLNSTALLTREHRTVLDAFRLLQRDPNVQKMVMSLSSDRTVWDAVMNNEAVQEFRRSFQDGKENNRKGCCSSVGPAGVLKWILGNTQAKIVEFFDNIVKIVSMLFHPQSEEDKPDLYSDAVKVSFMLSVFVFIVVAIARINDEPWDFKVW
ncbi:uncharacterized protein LOC124687468 [Lolium rigidum]|uniref:uncharacterized protein LOC124687468 n=1 Tax=Lolium rigidum TaxID=89674 RepID=UPI001F5CD6BF|nr:uncharacterized protein LOC124687468 [Lolium rigidum]XP_051193480.1 uncharacterized protein LOC127306807 isoform X2 [Lolium perenne]